MNPKILLTLGITLVGTALGAQTLDPASELTLAAPWSQPVVLGPASEGRYRLEATTLAGDPVEVVVDRKNPDGTWSATGTNRTLRGSLEASLEISIGLRETWRVRPALPERSTVILRLRQSSFAELRDALKQVMTDDTTGSPLTKRLELPPATGGPGLAGAVGRDGSLWVGWLTDGGWSAEVWDAVRGRRMGPPLLAATAPWTRFSLRGTTAPEVVLTGEKDTITRSWSGSGWVVVPSPAGEGLETKWGTLRIETQPSMRILRATSLGWDDLSLPRDDQADRIRVGSTDDGLAVFLASSVTDHRAFYTWNPDRGWTAFPPPPASGPPWSALWAVSTGAGNLYHLEGDDTHLWLRCFDGAQWRPAIDLSRWGRGAVGAALLSPSSWSKTGTLVLATDRVTVYDLP